MKFPAAEGGARARLDGKKLEEALWTVADKEGDLEFLKMSIWGGLGRTTHRSFQPKLTLEPSMLAATCRKCAIGVIRQVILLGFRQYKP